MHNNYNCGAIIKKQIQFSLSMWYDLCKAVIQQLPVSLLPYTACMNKIKYSKYHDGVNLNNHVLNI